MYIHGINMYVYKPRNASRQRDAAEQLGFDEGSWDSDAMVQICWCMG